MFEKIDLNGMSADELDLLIAQASARRLAQEPAHPTEAPEHCPTVHNPAWFTFPTEQGSVLRLRHPGLGWVSFQIPAAERAQLLNLLLIWELRHAGLALSISLGACLNAALLLRGLRRRAIYMPQPGWGVFILKLALAVYVMGAVLWLLSGSAVSWLAAGAAERIGRMALLVFAGAGAYFATLWVTGFRPRDFARDSME